jgi:hypothetical protein
MYLSRYIDVFFSLFFGHKILFLFACFCFCRHDRSSTPSQEKVSKKGVVEIGSHIVCILFFFGFLYS